MSDPEMERLGRRLDAKDRMMNAFDEQFPWEIKERPYVGDGDIFLGYCRQCDYMTGKSATYQGALGAVRDHAMAKHGWSP